MVNSMELTLDSRTQTVVKLYYSTFMLNIVNKANTIVEVY